MFSLICLHILRAPALKGLGWKSLKLWRGSKRAPQHQSLKSLFNSIWHEQFINLAITSEENFAKMHSLGCDLSRNSFFRSLQSVTNCPCLRLQSRYWNHLKPDYWEGIVWCQIISHPYKQIAETWRIFFFFLIGEISFLLRFQEATSTSWKFLFLSFSLFFFITFAFQSRRNAISRLHLRELMLLF